MTEQVEIAVWALCLVAAAQFIGLIGMVLAIRTLRDASSMIRSLARARSRVADSDQTTKIVDDHASDRGFSQ